MGFLSNFMKGLKEGSAEHGYENAVHQKLKKDFELDRSRHWRLKSFDGHIAGNKAKRISADETAIEVAVAYYVAQCLGDPQDRRDAGYLYISLKPAILIAGLSGSISTARAEELTEVVSNYTQQSVLMDMEEGTGVFARRTES